MFQMAALTTFLVTVLIIGTLVFDAWDYLSKLADTDNGLGALFDIGWFPRRGIFDIGTLVIGTLIVTGIAMLVAVPLGLGAAVYLSEYAKPRVRRVFKPIIEILAGIPSVVLGYFAISFINPNLVANLFSSANQAFTLAAAGMAVGVLTIPIIASVTEDALRAVPMALREGSFGLGGKRSQTTFRIVFPAAISGIVAALILGMSRAIGETMVVAIAAGATGGGLFSLDPLQPGQTMTAAMAALGFGSDQVAGDDLAFQSLYFVGLLLFVMTFALNLASDRLVARVREEY
jgi:phosphate transport system permease protein